MPQTGSLGNFFHFLVLLFKWVFDAYLRYKCIFFRYIFFDNIYILRPQYTLGERE